MDIGTSLVEQPHGLAYQVQSEVSYYNSAVEIGPARSADLLEVVTIVRDDGSELVIHAMRMRPKYRRLLPEG